MKVWLNDITALFQYWNWRIIVSLFEQIRYKLSKAIQDFPEVEQEKQNDYLPIPANWPTQII